MSSLEILKKYSPVNAHLFIETIVDKLLTHNVSIIISEDLQVRYEENERVTFSSGYFSNNPLVFAVALGKPFLDWFLVFIHEYHHFEQHTDNAQWFNDICTQSDKIFSWIAGEELSAEEIEKCLMAAKLIESDCEKRVLANIKKFNIQEFVNIEEYTQKANSYFNFYNYVAATRKWYVGGKEPYMLKEVWSQFPKEIIVYDKLLPEHALLFKKCV